MENCVYFFLRLSKSAGGGSKQLELVTEMYIFVKTSTQNIDILKRLDIIKSLKRISC